MGRVVLLTIGFFALLCAAPVRAAVQVQYQEKFSGMLCICFCGFYVYTRRIRFLRRGAGEYALLFYDKRETLKDTVTLWPPKKKKYGRRLLEKQEIREILHALFYRQHIRFADVQVHLRGGDAAALAQVYGVLCAAASELQALCIQKNIPFQIALQVDFDGSSTEAQAGCMVCDPLGKLIVTALRVVGNRKENAHHGKTSH